MATLYTRTDLQGVDVYINRLQNQLDKKLPSGLVSEIYGRCYKIDKDGIGNLPYWYYQDKGYDLDVLASDSTTRIFFTVDDSFTVGARSNGAPTKAKVNIYCFLKLSESSERKDERARMTVLQAVNNGVFEIKEVVKGVDQIISDFDLKDDNIKWSDLHPYHVFTIRTEVEYSLKLKC